MTAGEWSQVMAGGVTVVLLLVAAVGDLARYRISNRIVVAVIVVFLIGAAFGASLHGFAWSLLAAFVVFLVGAGLFALGLFGGGDVKLITAMALWTGIADLPRFLLVMSATGGVLGVAWLVRRRFRHAPSGRRAATSPDPRAVDEPSSRPDVPSKIPYGVAIAIAGLDFFVTSPHSPFVHLWALAS